MTHACAQCGRMLQQTGRLDFRRESYAVFQCTDCLMQWDVGEEKVLVTFTFALSPSGALVSAADPTRLLESEGVRR